MKVEFNKRKYDKPLLIDCFWRNEYFKEPDSQNPFIASFYEVIFITEGSGTFKLDDETIPFERGTVLLLPPNKWRQWSEIDVPYDGIYLIFEEEFISQFFNDSLYLYRFHYFYNTATPSKVQLDETELENMLPRLHEVALEIQNLNPDSSHLLRALLYYLLIGLNRKYQKSIDQESFYKEPFVLKFRKLLEEHIETKQRVSDYAELLQVSTSHLNKLSKKYFSKTGSEIIKDRLVQEIKKRLLFTDKSVSEIGYDLGFSEASNFNRFFQSRVNSTPNDYRIQNDNS